MRVRIERDLAKYHGVAKPKHAGAPRRKAKSRLKAAPKAGGLTFNQVVKADRNEQDRAEAKRKGQTVEGLRAWRQAKGVGLKATAAEKRERDLRIMARYGLTEAELKALKRG